MRPQSLAEAYLAATPWYRRAKALETRPRPLDRRPSSVWVEITRDIAAKRDG